MTKDDAEKLQVKANELQAALVLIIENKPSEQRFFSLIEETVGMVSCFVESCSAALEALNFVRFNLIILDLQIPCAQAIECAKEIQLFEHGRGIKTPIIAVTAHAMSGDREKCLNAGMDDYLAKPFSLALLKQMVTQWAEGSDARSRGEI